MCFANDDCQVEGRRKATGRRCKECGYVKAECSNCGNTWSYHNTESHPVKCPECGKH